MRWTEIAEQFGHTPGIILPTYRQMDTWTRQGLLVAEFKGDRHGKFRWWNPIEVEAALTVAALIKYGMSAELAFQVARVQPGPDGRRRLRLASNLGVEIEAEPLPVDIVEPVDATAWS